MSDTILTALITGVFVVIPTLITSYFANNKNQALITYRLDKIEDKVNQQHQLVKRTAKLELKQAVLQEQIKTINGSLDKLEKDS